MTSNDNFLTNLVLSHVKIKINKITGRTFMASFVQQISTFSQLYQDLDQK